jgi:hypothetical protein
MKTYWLLLEDGFPSMNHCRFNTEEECVQEMKRIQECDRLHNERVITHPATGRGSAFINKLRERVFSIRSFDE